MLVAGGTNDRTAEIFDPATGKFTTVAGLMTIAREDAVAAALPDGRVLIAGGYDPVGATTLQTAEIFNPQTNTFSSTGSLMVTKLSGAAAASLGDGRVLIAGGYDGANESKGGMTYDPKTNTFSTVNSTMSKTASLNAAASLPDGEAMVVGGQNPGGDLKTAALFNPSSNTFSESGLGQMPFERKLLAASPVLSTGQVLVAGGYYNGGPTKSALLFGTSDAFTTKTKGKKLIVTVASPGTLTVAGATAGAAAAKKGKSLLKPSTRTGGPGPIKLKLKLRKPAAAKLARKGKLKLRATISFSPDAGFTRTQTVKLKLKRG